MTHIDDTGYEYAEDSIPEAGLWGDANERGRENGRAFSYGLISGMAPTEYDYCSDEVADRIA